MTTRRPDLDQKRLARDVARELEASRRRRRVVVGLLVIGAIIAAVLYLTCGKGWGVGGKGKGEGAGSGPGTGAVVAVDAGPTRCALRLAEAGLTVDGKPATRDEAIAACKQTTGGAEVLVTGDARQGDWDDLRAALEAAGIIYTTREPRGTGPANDAGAPAPPAADAASAP